jgi:hypothetical protein
MTRELFNNELQYQYHLSIARQLLSNRILFKDEFLSIESKLRSEFEPLIGSLTSPKLLDM